MKYSIALFVAVIMGPVVFAELENVHVSAVPGRHDASGFLTKFVWPEHPLALSNCVTQVPSPYSIAVQPRNGGISENRELRFSVGDELRLSVTGHSQTVFILASNVLYVAELHPRASGCSIAAFDLQNSKLLWRTGLHGLLFVVHSLYSNRVQLHLTPTLVVVKGREGGGDYVECLDRTTGKVVGHRIFRHWQPESLKGLKEISTTNSTLSTEGLPSVEK